MNRSLIISYPQQIRTFIDSVLNPYRPPNPFSQRRISKRRNPSAVNLIIPPPTPTKPTLQVLDQQKEPSTLSLSALATIYPDKSSIQHTQKNSRKQNHKPLIKKIIHKSSKAASKRLRTGRRRFVKHYTEEIRR